MTHQLVPDIYRGVSGFGIPVRTCDGMVSRNRIATADPLSTHRRREPVSTTSDSSHFVRVSTVCAFDESAGQNESELMRSDTSWSVQFQLNLLTCLVSGRSQSKY